MCLPALPAPLMTALSIASTAASVVGQMSQANAQAQANRQQYENTMTAYRANMAQVELGKIQERDAAVQKLNENNLDARRATATALTTSGENGVSGLSVDAFLADIGSKRSVYNQSVRTNYENRVAQLDLQRENVYANAASSINGLKTPATPDYLGGALKIANIWNDSKLNK